MLGYDGILKDKGEIWVLGQLIASISTRATYGQGAVLDFVSRRVRKAWDTIETRPA